LSISISATVPQRATQACLKRAQVARLGQRVERRQLDRPGFAVADL